MINKNIVLFIIMKILLVTDLYPLENEKITKALYYFVQELQKQGHCVEVIRANFIINTLVRGRKIKKENIYYEDGTKIYNLNFHTPFLFDVYKKLPKDFSLKKYDVIISHMPCGALMADKLLKKDSIKYICAVHFSDVVVLKSFLYLLFRNKLKNVYKKADKIAARSYVLQKKIEEIIPETQNKTFVAYSGIDTDYISDSIKATFNRDEVQISTVASLIKRKNIDVIINSIVNINHKIHLKIIGDGPERKRLEKLTQKLNISDKVTFLGGIAREKVISKLKESDIFILLSRNETFGISYLEAMATGNIVIAKKEDGIDGIIQNSQNGFLINSEVGELKSCIENIIKMSDEEIEIIRQKSLDTIKRLTIKESAENYINNIVNNDNI